MSLVSFGTPHGRFVREWIGRRLCCHMRCFDRSMTGCGTRLAPRERALRAS